MPSMNDVFAPCGACARHVRVSDRTCPFCDAPQRERAVVLVNIERTHRGAAIAMVAALAGCEHSASSAQSQSVSVSAVQSAPDVTVIAPADVATAAPDAATAADVQVVNAFDGLGLTGVGAAYGASPLDPRFLDVGEQVLRVEVRELRPHASRVSIELASRINEVRACFYRAPRHPRVTAEGVSVTVRFEVGRDGRVRTATAASEGLPAFARCVQQRIRDVRFASTSDPAAETAFEAVFRLVPP